jgi:pSer/pThr/pTyr-binding forkhead associated (FHA) protein
MAAYRPDSGRAAAAGAPLVERTRAVDAGGSAAPRRRSTGSSPVALEIDGRRHPLTGAVTTLGRDEGCTIVVDDAGASRRHAEIRISHDGPHLQVILRDLGSTNGTYLNGEQVGSEELRDRDRITMGRTHIVVHLEG